MPHEKYTGTVYTWQWKYQDSRQQCQWQQKAKNNKIEHLTKSKPVNTGNTILDIQNFGWPISAKYFHGSISWPYPN